MKTKGVFVVSEDFVDFRALAFAKGLHMLMAEGMPEGRARSLIGKWRKLAGNDDEALCDLLDRAAAIDPIVLAEWMGASLQVNSRRIQMKGDAYLIPPGTDQWEAWHRWFKRMNDPRVYRKGVLEVPSLWPR